MKKLLQFIALYLIFGLSAYGQNFIQVTKINDTQSVTIGMDDVLEIKLPAVPSTGYGWYLKDEESLRTVTQTGDWFFESSDPENPVGASGTQTIRLIGTSKGVNDLEFLYKRPWEAAAQATDSYKITVASEGAYSNKTVAFEPEPVIQEMADVSKTRNAALPASFSWLAAGKCTPVKNQGSCGSCWAFASCGSFESVIKIFDRVTKDLSEQWMVSCDKKASGCSGGWCPNYMLQTGAVYETDHKYTQQNGTCKPSYTYHEKIASSHQLANTPTTEQIKQAIYDYGPVWACVNAGNNFSAYKSGVLTKTDGNQINHAIVLVGWDDAKKCWILRNSWGTGWGENSGYMRIGYGVSAVGYRATYIDYKGKIKHVVTGIENNKQASSIQVFPNPTTRTFVIEGLEKGNTVEVFDVVGKIIYHTSSENNAASINLSSQNKGIYFYKITNASSEAVKQGKVMVY